MSEQANKQKQADKSKTRIKRKRTKACWGKHNNKR